MDSIQKDKWTILLFVLALISSWLSFAFKITAWVGIIFWMIALVILFIRRSKLKWYLLVLSAWTVIPVFSFFSGVKDYFKGDAAFQFYGFPGPEFHNLNDEYRVWASTSGCVVSGFEWLTQIPNNEAIVLCTQLFGFQKGVYTGFYPGKEETSRLIDSTGTRLSFTETDHSFQFQWDERNFEVMGHRRYGNKDSITVASFVNYNNELIIFKPLTQGDETITYLADSKTGEIFAKYYEQVDRSVNFTGSYEFEEKLSAHPMIRGQINNWRLNLNEDSLTGTLEIEEPRWTNEIAVTLLKDDNYLFVLFEKPTFGVVGSYDDSGLKKGDELFHLYYEEGVLKTA